MPDIDQPAATGAAPTGAAPTGAAPTGAAPPASPLTPDGSAASPAIQGSPGTAPAGRAWPGMRVRTLVLGLIFLVVSGSVLTSQLTGISVDPGVIGLSLMVGAGVLLLAGSATRRS